MEILIRKATLSDLNSLAVLKQQVWISTYATNGLIEEFSNYVLSEYSAENVRESITDKNKLTLIALNDGCIIGCVEILLTPKNPIKKIKPCIEISTFYILERFQGVGIGKKLLTECLNEIEKLNHDKVWLTVYYKNQQAIDFYQKQGFNHIGKMDFMLGKDKHMNYIMIKNIKE
ncbi:MAG: GNAT family N-acetyltransferase [Labilibaculum antarcticum]